MKLKFVDIKLSQKRLDMIANINTILEEYAIDNYTLTLRQLYYQLVTKNIIKNDDREYDRLSSTVTKGRMAGLIDWDAIEDRVRLPRLDYWCDDVAAAIKDAAGTYKLDRMVGQNVYLELWVEKDALSSVLRRKTDYYHIRLMVNRGYSSTTAMYDAYNRILNQIAQGKKATILYLGDHDPSGLDMVRDIKVRLLRMLVNQPNWIEDYFMSNYTNELQERLVKVANDYAFYFGRGETDLYSLLEDWAVGEELEVTPDNLLKFFIYDMFDIRHIGLTTEQVKQYDPPPNPAKVTDPRAGWYIGKFGKVSWEVDALNPKILHEIIDTNILSLIDEPTLLARIEEEKDGIEELEKLPTDKLRLKYVEQIFNAYPIPVPETLIYIKEGTKKAVKEKAKNYIKLSVVNEKDFNTVAGFVNEMREGIEDINYLSDMVNRLGIDS